MKLRIAMLSVHSCPFGELGAENTGGMSVYIRELCKELGRRGHIVDVFTRTHEPIHDQILKFGQNARLIHFKAGDEEDMNRLKIYPYLSEFSRQVDKFSRQNGYHYDLIHSHYWLSGLVGRQLQQWWDIPHVTMFHTLGAVKNAVDTGIREPEVRIKSEKEIIKDCHRIIAPTGREKDYLINYYNASPETISIIPCGVNLDIFRIIEKEIARNILGFNGEGIILFVGRIVPIKGIDKLLMALNHLENIERLRLLVIGGDKNCQDEVNRLRRLSKNLKIESSVTFLGLVEQEKLPYFYSAADICVFPSHYESFGLVALESLACGTPVVATDVGGIRSVVRDGETGYIVLDNVPHLLAEKITLALSTPRAKTDASYSIRESVFKFSWSNIAEATLQEYQTFNGKKII
ncbi:MAG: glycosyltransferase [Desulfobacterales bacterium]|nr:glycosyltransferase [Pseudomonadota bacterium]MCG2777466.1 glycosyltransferase [Desulfobacterales bacterium]